MKSLLLFRSICSVLLIFLSTITYAQLPPYKDCQSNTPPGVPGFSATCGHATNWAYITSVSTTGGINNITNNNTNCGNSATSYSDYTGTSMRVTQNAGQSVDVKIGWNGNDNGGSTQIQSTMTKIFVDWNRDGDFINDPDEYIAPPPAGVGQPNNHIHDNSGITITIDVPPHAKEGLTRMRIITSAQNFVATIPSLVTQCNGNFGEAEDYTFEVINPCVPPNVISIANVDYKSGDFSWTQKANAEFYEYVITPVDTIPHDTVIGFTFTTANTVDVDTFKCDTKYYILVRTICDTANKARAVDWDKSAWIRDSFVTHPCCYQPDVKFDQVTHNSARIKWDAIPTAIGYEYAVSTTNTPPQGNANYTINTSVLLQGLSPKTTYFAYVRSRCVPTPLSDWSQVAFKTSGALSVNDIGSGEISMLVYPNPVQNVINVELGDARADNATVTLSDITGKLIYRTQITSDKLEIDATDLSSGIYIIKYADDEHQQVMRVSKQ